jgi:hypothetical protein
MKIYMLLRSYLERNCKEEKNVLSLPGTNPDRPVSSFGATSSKLSRDLKGTLNLQTGVEDTLHLNERFY